MLYNFFELFRDENLRNITFGRSERVGYSLGQSYRSLISPKLHLHDHCEGLPWDAALTVGLTVGLEGVPRSLPLYKSVEVWNQLQKYHPSKPTEKPRVVGYPVVLERLLYRNEHGYMPYCWRYIDPRSVIQSLVHCDNLEIIHGGLQGLDGELSIQDPRRAYLDQLSEHRAWCPDERLDKLRSYTYDCRTPERLSRHSFSSKAIQDLLTHMERSLSFSWDYDERYSRRKDPLYIYQEFVEPARYVGDPISQQTPIGEIPLSHFMKFSKPSSFDVSPPPALLITHPTLTQTSSKACSAIAQALDQVFLTDYAVHVKLVNGSPVSHRWDYAVNRYSHLFDIPPLRRDMEIQLIKQAAEIAFRCVKDMDTDITHVGLIDLLDDTEVSITKSFAEEILVTLSCRGKTVCAWHIDIAAMTFCSMGLAVENPMFP